MYTNDVLHPYNTGEDYTKYEKCLMNVITVLLAVLVAITVTFNVDLQ